jgi:hypothetical protein
MRPDIVVRPLVGTPLSARHLLAWPKDGCLARHVERVQVDLTQAYGALAAESPVYTAWLAEHQGGLQGGLQRSMT